MRKSKKTRRGLGVDRPHGVLENFFNIPFYLNLKEQEFAAKEKLEIVNVLGFAFQFARPPNPSHAPRGEDRIPFELFLEYIAKIRNQILESHRRSNPISAFNADF